MGEPRLALMSRHSDAEQTTDSKENYEELFSPHVDHTQHRHGMVPGIFFCQYGPHETSRMEISMGQLDGQVAVCLLYTSPSPRDATLARMPSSA